MTRESKSIRGIDTDPWSAQHTDYLLYFNVVVRLWLFRREPNPPLLSGTSAGMRCVCFCHPRDLILRCDLPKTMNGFVRAKDHQSEQSKTTYEYYC